VTTPNERKITQKSGVFAVKITVLCTKCHENPICHRTIISEYSFGEVITTDHNIWWWQGWLSPYMADIHRQSTIKTVTPPLQWGRDCFFRVLCQYERNLSFLMGKYV
jgi:hypothetical protein